jgi:NTE family protein
MWRRQSHPTRDDNHAPRDVFVLSGGGSRGAAQIGMMRALLAEGVVPTHFVGASVGAINACGLAVAPTLERLDVLTAYWLLTTTESLIGPRRSILSNLAHRRPYLYAADRLRQTLATWVDTPYIEDLAVPTRIATTDLLTGVAHHHDEGPLIDLVAASAALPAVLPPVMLSGRQHVDAGVSENLPLTGAVSLVRPGDRIWALDVTRRPGRKRLNSPVDVLVAALQGAISTRPAPTFPDNVDLVHIRLDDGFDSGSLFDFDHTAELVAAGEATAHDILTARRGHLLSAA